MQQSGFAFLGDLAKFSIQYLGPHMSAIVTAVLGAMCVASVCVLCGCV